jgi:3',5'-cyclic AMP phosphodiesterase CpdA
MQTIIHVSDLHFGRENQEIVAALLQEIERWHPNVVVVSGDLTQRARKREFQAAAEFLAQITAAKIVVPGNHDVPLYNLTHRFLQPFSRYTRYINSELFPTYQDELVIIVGVNTAYSLTWKSGRITSAQLEVLETKFKQAADRLKVLTIHHPYQEIFIRQHHHDFLTACGVDLILSGHIHQAGAGILSNHITKLDQKTLNIQAGTSVSHRLRGERNSFNHIAVLDANNVIVTIMEYAKAQFTAKLRYHFIKINQIWQQA